jgi:hypothetical protein
VQARWTYPDANCNCNCHGNPFTNLHRQPHSLAYADLIADSHCNHFAKPDRVINPNPDRIAEPGRQFRATPGH